MHIGLFAIRALQKEPSIMPKEEFLMTVVCDTELSGIPEGVRNLLEEHRSNWFL